MPSLEVLDALQAIVKKLEPLGNVHQGDPLRAADWNQLVDCLTRIAATLLDREASGTLPDHDHPDQVGLDWLDPNLKRLMEKGPLHEPEAMARLGKLERDLEKLRSSLKDSDSNVAKIRGNVHDIGTAKIGQEGRLKNLELRLKNLPDARQDVLTLNERISSMIGKLDQTLAFEDRLNVDGAPVDLVEIQKEFSKTKALREGLTDPNGNLWTAETIRRELTQLQNSLVTKEDLELALERVTSGGPILDPQLDAFLAGRVKDLVNEQIETMPAGTDPALATRLDAVEQAQQGQSSILEDFGARLDQAPNLDQIDSISQRVKSIETASETRIDADANLLKSFGRLSQFLEGFSRPSTATAPPPILDIRSLRFNVAINNNRVLREKLMANGIDSVEELAQLPDSTLSSFMRGSVTTGEADIIKRNIAVLSGR